MNKLEVQFVKKKLEKMIKAKFEVFCLAYFSFRAEESKSKGRVRMRNWEEKKKIKERRLRG